MYLECNFNVDVIVLRLELILQINIPNEHTFSLRYLVLQDILSSLKVSVGHDLYLLQKQEYFVFGLGLL
jgi:hypothetical protein